MRLTFRRLKPVTKLSSNLILSNCARLVGCKHSHFQAKIAKKGDLVRALVEEDERKHRYVKWKVKDLRSFAEMRSLPVRNGSKMDLEKVMEENDAQYPFRFMDPPPELRIRVYSFAVLGSKYCSTEIGYWLELSGTHGHGPLAEHPVTRVLRQARMESLPIFYKFRRFPLGNAYERNCRVPILKWIDKISETQWTCMKAFKFTVYGFYTRRCGSAGLDGSHECRQGYFHIDFDSTDSHYDITFTTKCGNWTPVDINELTSMAYIGRQWDSKMADFLGMAKKLTELKQKAGIPRRKLQDPR